MENFLQSGSKYKVRFYLDLDNYAKKIVCKHKI